MADVQCGKFELIRQNPQLIIRRDQNQTGNLTFRARLIPAPSDQWTTVFHEYQATECGLGNLAVARIEGDVIEFEVSEAGSQAAAEVIRRCVDRTNPEAAKRQAARQKQHEAQQKQVDEEWRRLQDKFRDGL